MIEMLHVSKTYPSQIEALSDIALEVSAGEFVFIVGPSGSGKSTLLRILYGAEKPSRGEVIINGMRITQPRFKRVHQLRRTMGIISPDFRLLRDRNVRENVAFALEVMGHAHQEIEGRVSEILRRVGLGKRERDSIFTLSAGEQQRVAIARALVNAPPLILADEPTGILDDRMTDRVMGIFGELHQKGTTIVFATQDVALIQRHPYPAIPLVAGRQVNVETDEKVSSEA